MIPQTLRITLIIVVIFYFIFILYYLKKKMLELRYTLLWLFAGVIMGIMIIFPELLQRFIWMVGIQSNMNGLFILLIGFCIMLLMMLTAIVSRNAMKTRALIQEIGLLEKRVRELEEEQTEYISDDIKELK